MSFIGKMIGNKCPLFDARLATSRKDTRFNYYDKKWLSAKHFGWANGIFCSSANLAIIVPKPLVAYGSELFRGRFDRRLIQMTAAFILSERLKQPSAQEAKSFLFTSSNSLPDPKTRQKTKEQPCTKYGGKM